MTLAELQQAFFVQGIELIITKKRVKNINFRIKLNECHVSVPAWASEKAAIMAVYQRLDWVVQANERLRCRFNAPSRRLLTLWGEPADLPDDEAAVLAIYRQQLQARIGQLMAKWQPIVGRAANEVRLRKMTTRWGTCNTRQGRIWLSVYLAAYPYECTEYVFVHELCHLIHANHSPLFWAEVKKAMPDYKKWHDLLKGRVVD